MCTATWLGGGQASAAAVAAGDTAPGPFSGYTLCFNRDESRSRPGERPVRAFRRGGVECLAPADGAAGGTWIGVNEFGFTACLLNAYPAANLARGAAPRAGRLLSRGHLIVGLLDGADLAAARQSLRAGDLRWFRPFRLLALAPGEAPSCFFWDGLRLQEQAQNPEHGMVCSSAWDDARANRARRSAWERWLAAGEPSESALLAYHASHEPDCGAASVCMHREDAATVSFARVRVTTDAVRLLHSPGAPCAWIAGAELELRRRALAASSPARPRTSGAGSAISAVK